MRNTSEYQWSWEEERPTILREIQAGASLYNLARRYRRSERQMRRILTDLHLSVRPRTDEEKMVAKLERAGVNVHAIRWNTVCPVTLKPIDYANGAAYHEGTRQVLSKTAHMILTAAQNDPEVLTRALHALKAGNSEKSTT